MLQTVHFPNNQELLDVIKNVKNRVQAIALVHEMLYNTQDLSQISIKLYIERLISLIFQSFDISLQKINISFEAEDHFILLDTAIPFGLILNELLTNSLKYAFPDNRQGEIQIKFKLLENGWFQLLYSDNGIGVPIDFDFKKQKSLGLSLIFNIGERQMSGKIKIESNQGIQCCFEFPANLFQARV